VNVPSEPVPVRWVSSVTVLGRRMIVVAAFVPAYVILTDRVSSARALDPMARTNMVVNTTARLGVALVRFMGISLCSGRPVLVALPPYRRRKILSDGITRA
jgi:hypothetical protein